MTTTHDPWAEIQSVRDRLLVNRRRVDGTGSQNIFWTRDDASKVGLWLEISKTISGDSLLKAKINIRDILIDVRQTSDGLRGISIVLEQERNKDVFIKLCYDIVEYVTANSNMNDTFELTCKRLKKWQSLFTAEMNRLLSSAEIQGLYTELYFLGEMLNRHRVYEHELVNGWQGPSGNQQDFILASTAVEIKSISGIQRGIVRISSEDQLETHLDRLYLCVYFLAEQNSQGKGESLNSVVKRIFNQLTDDENKEMFEQKLQRARYIDISDYDTPMFDVSMCKIYLIDEGFPRITRANIASGIVSVTYGLVLATLEDFLTDTIIIWDN